MAAPTVTTLSIQSSAPRVATEDQNSAPPAVEKSYTVATLPAADVSYLKRYFVSDEASGAQFCYSDGRVWRRESDRKKARALPNSFILNGQSCAAAAPPVSLGFSALTQYLGPNLQGWYDTTMSFVPVVDGSANAKANTPGAGTGTGPGLGQVGTRLAWHLAATVGTVCTFALAYTSQNIDYFLPASLTRAFFEDGTQHPTLNNYNLLKAYVAASGIVPKKYIFDQGQANAGTDQATYYAKLKTLFLQTRADYPGIEWILVGTIGDALQRSVNGDGSSGASVTPVFAAQKQLADEYPDEITFVDNRDMSGKTASFGGKFNGNHYSTYAGYEEDEERIFAAMKGETRGSVADVAHLADVYTWENIYFYRHSVQVQGGSNDVVAWQGDLQANSLAPSAAPSPVTNAPAQISYSTAFGGRTVVDFDAAHSESVKITGLGASSNWSVFAVAKSDLTTPTRALFYLQDAGVVSRVAFEAAYQAQQYAYSYAGADAALVGYGTDTLVHSFLFVVDTTALKVRLYIDGALFATADIAGTQVNMTELWIASFLGAVGSFFDGQIAVVAYARSAADLTVAQKAHAWTKVEFKL